jgi:tripartite ATP-independent transporter DctP family solute receptor
MKSRNLLIIGLVIVSCYASLIIFSSLATAADSAFPKMVWKLGVSVNPDFNFYKGSVKFSQLMKERTGGAIDVQVFPNGTLGSDNDMAEQVRNGIIQLWAGGSMTLSMVEGWGPLNVVNLPYILKQDSEAAQNKFLNDLFDTPFMKNMAEKGANTSNLRALDLNWFYGMRHVTTKNKPIKTPADLKNLKIRTMDSPIGRLAMEKLGASATPMAFPEVYTSLQMGVIDGQENPPATIYANKFYEVQKYLSLTGHNTQSIVLCIDNKLYQSLSPALRTIVDKSAKDAGKYQTELQIGDNVKAMDSLKKAGMIINTVNRAEFAENSKDSWKRLAPQVTQELYDQIINAQK